MVSAKAVNELQKNLIDRREFHYEKGIVSLDFKLRTDTNIELAAFKECLDAASADIERMIKHQAILDS